MNSRRISTNVQLLRHLIHNDTITVRLFQTDVLTFYPDERVALTAGAWRTVTTKKWMNEYLPGRGIGSTYGHWHVSVKFRLKDQGWEPQWVTADVPFVNRMTINTLTCELVDHPDTEPVVLDTIVQDELQAASRPLHKYEDLLDEKGDDVTKSELAWGLTLVKRYREHEEELARHLRSLTDGTSYYLTAVEERMMERIDRHAEVHYPKKEALKEVKGQERLKVI